MKIGFVLMSLQPSGGNSIALQYAHFLAEKNEVTLILPDNNRLRQTKLSKIDPGYFKIIDTGNMKLSSLKSEVQEFDLVILTFWATITLTLDSTLKSKNWIHFCQSIEDRFGADPSSYLKLDVAYAQSAYAFNIPVITEASWIKEVLLLRGSQQVIEVIPNPILKSPDVLPKTPEQLKGVNLDRLVVVIEGESSWFKGVSESIKALELLTEGLYEVHFVGDNHEVAISNWRVDVVLHGRVSRKAFHEILSKSDVLLKMSHVEGMYGPPLEAFSYGTTCITSSVTGHEEFVEHRGNGLVVNISDYFGASQWLQKINSNRNLLENLNRRALETSKKWPDEATIAKKLVSAVEKIRRSNATYQTLASYTLASEKFWNAPNFSGRENRTITMRKRHLLLVRELLRQRRYLTLLNKGSRFLVRKFI
jgi:glycosyltransferase involved in cell wall biosynthesis